jgi:putative peptidoglycan lipid II flippase
MLPAVFGVSVAQINLLINTILASFLVTGSVSWLYYSDRLMEFPLGVFGVALATVILPNLSKKHQRASHRSFSHTLDWALRWTWLVGLPATVGLIVLAGPMLVTLFNYGAFTAHDVNMSRLSLIAFSAGLLVFLFIKVLATGFYARQDMKTPVRVGVIALLANIGFSLALVFTLAHTGLALATSLAAFVNAALLYRALTRSGSYRPLPGWSWLLARIMLASVGMGVLLWWGAGELGEWLAATALERALRLAAWIAGGVMVYVLSMYVLGMRWHMLTLAKADGELD